MKKKYVLVIILLIGLLSVWQYQKYMNNKISMSEKIQKMEDAIKKENFEIYKLVISDTVKKDTVEDIKTYTIEDIEEIEKFTALFENLKGTTLNTNKKGIVGSDYEYSLLFYFGYLSSDGEFYIENGRFYLDLNEDKVDAFRLDFYAHLEKMRIELNGQLEKNSEPFDNPFIEYVIEAIESGKVGSPHK